MSLKIEIGIRIQGSRKKLKLSQEEVAAVLKCPQGTVSRIESGEYSGSPHFLRYLIFLRKKGISLNKLFENIEESNLGASPS